MVEIKTHTIAGHGGFILVKIYGHRGASAELPENTLPAFQRVIDLGADGVEFDVHLSSDGVPVVIHDDTVDRTTRASGPVNSFTAEELGNLDAGAGYGVPTLRDVLDLVGTSLHLNIEIKSAEAGQAVIDEVVPRLGLRWAISSFDWEVLRFVRGQCPGADVWPLTFGPRDSIPAAADRVAAMDGIYPNALRMAEKLRRTRNVLEDALDLARDLKSSTVSVNQFTLTQESIDAVHRAGFATFVWTVNDPQRASQLDRWGVDSVCTDEPAVIVPARSSVLAVA